MKKHAVIILIATLLGSLSAMAEFVGPATSDSGYHTVRDVLDRPVDDQKIVLQGYLAQKLANERYSFTDNTGSITVEIDDESFPPEPIRPDMLVEIRGRIDADFMRAPEIDARYISIIRHSPKK